LDGRVRLKALGKEQKRLCVIRMVARDIEPACCECGEERELGKQNKRRIHAIAPTKPATTQQATYRYDVAEAFSLVSSASAESEGRGSSNRTVWAITTAAPPQREHAPPKSQSLAQILTANGILCVILLAYGDAAAIGAQTVANKCLREGALGDKSK
jgi:hypothetical protein